VERFVALDTIPLLVEIVDRACCGAAFADEVPLPRTAAGALGLLDLVGRSRAGQEILTASGSSAVGVVVLAAGNRLEAAGEAERLRAAGPASGAGRSGGRASID